MTMKKHILVFCAAAFLFAVSGCGESADLIECRQENMVLKLEAKAQSEQIKDLQGKVDSMKEMVRKKHEEVALHRNLPEVTDRKMVGIEQDMQEMQEEFRALELRYEALLRRYDSQQRDLMRCRQKLTDPQ